MATEIQNVEADFIIERNVFQQGTTQGWTWAVADTGRFLYHDVVPGQANQTVAVTGRTVSTDNNLNPTAAFTVTLTSPVGSSPPGLMNFVAIRVPSS
jgi:hypothetical protein